MDAEASTLAAQNCLNGSKSTEYWSFMVLFDRSSLSGKELLGSQERGNQEFKTFSSKQLFAFRYVFRFVKLRNRLYLKQYFDCS